MPHPTTSHVPQDVVDWFGDMRWFDAPGLFSHPQCQVDGVAMSDLVAALRRVYSPTTVGKQVRAGAGSDITGLFVGTGWIGPAREQVDRRRLEVVIAEVGSSA